MERSSLSDLRPIEPEPAETARTDRKIYGVTWFVDHGWDVSPAETHRFHVIGPRLLELMSSTLFPACPFFCSIDRQRDLPGIDRDRSTKHVISDVIFVEWKMDNGTEVFDHFFLTYCAGMNSEIWHSFALRILLSPILRAYIRSFYVLIILFRVMHFERV